MKKGAEGALAGNDRYEGYMADLVEELAEHLGLDYELRIVADGKYGDKNADGTWTGMIGELTRQVRVLLTV